MENFRINNDKIYEKFLAHLKMPDNKRILLSGRFGIGKTYFIQGFFENHGEYEPTFITPVNYQVANNEDIFGLIKYDILLEFLSKGIIDTEGVQVDEFLSLQFYIQNRSSDLILDLLSLFSKLGKANQLIKDLNNFIQDFKKYSKTINESQLDIVSRYAELVEDTEGSIYECDFLTKLIFELQDRIREKGKKSILVIDDIDRIEPEHIFRILNIFSSHYTIDISEEDNKFNFDQVILICDIDNIRKIFHSKYGQEVDFSGYIDKFYSKSCFHFNNTSSILKSLDSIFPPLKNNKFKDSIVNVTKYFLTDFIKANSVNLRDLQNIPSIANQLQGNKRFQITEDFSFSESNIPLIKALFTLREILGNDDQKVISCFNNCQQKIGESSIIKKFYFVKNLVPFININQTVFKIDTPQTIEIKDLGIKIQFKIVSTHDFELDQQYEVELIKSYNSSSQDKKENLKVDEFYFILRTVYKNIINISPVE